MPVADRRRYRRLAIAAGRMPPPAAPPATFGGRLLDARGQPGAPTRGLARVLPPASPLRPRGARRRRPPRRLRRSAGACSMREASAKRPHAAWRGCSRRLRSASTHERPAPRQQGQRVSAPLQKKGKRQQESAQDRCFRCRVSCPPFRVLVARYLPVLPLVPGWATLGPQPPRRGRRKRKGHQARERRPGSPKPWGGKSQSKETQRTSVLFLSCSEAQKLRFQGAAHSAALRGPFSPKIQRTKLCRAAPCRAHWEDRAPCCLGPPPFRQRRVGTAVPRPRL